MQNLYETGKCKKTLVGKPEGGGGGIWEIRVKIGILKKLSERKSVCVCVFVCVCVCVCVCGNILTFRHRSSCILGQVFHCSPEKAFYIFNQQIYFII